MTKNGICLIPDASSMKKQGGHLPKDRRQMINTVLWVSRTGATWRFFRIIKALSLPLTASYGGTKRKKMD
ncbi:hypothetical protein EGM68_22425 [Paenibacillus sp. M-152]|nr:hypothetical protein EGM68_22425 [Paenibacillus sp. M-152]